MLQVQALAIPFDFNFSTTPRTEVAPPSFSAKPQVKRLVRAKGVEPSRGFPHMDLNHARLPFRHTRVREA